MFKNAVQKGIIISLGCLLLLLLSGCSQSAMKHDSRYQDPDRALHAYFDALGKKDFATVAELYGGEYETLIGYNPTVPKEDHAKLMDQYCTLNGGNIVKIDQIIDKVKNSDEEYTYTLTFTLMDDTAFRNGKQCEYAVKKIDDSFKVMGLPPYTP